MNICKTHAQNDGQGWHNLSGPMSHRQLVKQSDQLQFYLTLKDLISQFTLDVATYWVPINVYGHVNFVTSYLYTSVLSVITAHIFLLELHLL